MANHASPNPCDLALALLALATSAHAQAPAKPVEVINTPLTVEVINAPGAQDVNVVNQPAVQEVSGLVGVE